MLYCVTLSVIVMRFGKALWGQNIDSQFIQAMLFMWGKNKMRDRAALILKA